MDDTIDGRQAIKKDKKAQEMLRQFLNTDGPAKCVNKAYDRGYEFSFRFSDVERSDVNYLMESMHMSFEEAFDAYMEYKKGGYFDQE